MHMYVYVVYTQPVGIESVLHAMPLLEAIVQVICIQRVTGIVKWADVVAVVAEVRTRECAVHVGAV